MAAVLGGHLVVLQISTGARPSRHGTHAHINSHVNSGLFPLHFHDLYYLFWTGNHVGEKRALEMEQVQ